MIFDPSKYASVLRMMGSEPDYVYGFMVTIPKGNEGSATERQVDRVLEYLVDRDAYLPQFVRFVTQEAFRTVYFAKKNAVRLTVRALQKNLTQ
jgi:hypothetical protein